MERTIGLGVGLAAALALAACAPDSAPSGEGIGQTSVALGSGEIWSFEPTPPDDYRRCLAAALLRYEAAERSTPDLVRRAREACESQAVEWQEQLTSQGTDNSGRRWYFMRSVEYLLFVAEELRMAVEDYRSRGAPLSELTEKM